MQCFRLCCIKILDISGKALAALQAAWDTRCSRHSDARATMAIGSPTTRMCLGDFAAGGISNLIIRQLRDGLCRLTSARLLSPLKVLSGQSCQSFGRTSLITSESTNNAAISTNQSKIDTHQSMSSYRRESDITSHTPVFGFAAGLQKYVQLCIANSIVHAEMPPPFLSASCLVRSFIK